MSQKYSFVSPEQRQLVEKIRKTLKNMPKYGADGLNEQKKV